jgi:hypothetical protein
LSSISVTKCFLDPFHQDIRDSQKACLLGPNIKPPNEEAILRCVPKCDEKLAIDAP